MQDILIIGAGPIGSYAARRLVEQGLRTLVVEEHDTIGEPEHCTGILSVEALRRFQLPTDCITRELRQATLFSPGGQRILLERDQPQAATVDRSRFDQSLAQAALGAGANFWLNSRVERITCAADHIAASVDSAGRKCRVRARLCLLATGVDRRLLAGWFESAPPRMLSGAQTEVEMSGVGEIELFFGRRIAPRSFAWLVPTSDHTAKLGVSTPGCAARALRCLLCTPMVRERLITEDPKLLCRPLPLGAAKRSVAERLMLIGDAAGQAKTTTGGGVYYGLLGAELAVETVLAAFAQGDFSERALRCYDRRWKKLIGRELKLGALLRQVAGKLSDRQLDCLFAAVSRNGLLPHIRRWADFDWHGNLILTLLRSHNLRAVTRAA